FPCHRSRNSRPLPSPQRIHRDGRLVFIILAPVHEDLAGANLLLHVRHNLVRMILLQQLCQCMRKRLGHLVFRGSIQRDINLQSFRTRGLGKALQSKMLEDFAHFGLQGFPKTSGSKGLQIYVPLNTPTKYEVTKPFAHALAQLLEQDHPDQVVSDMKKKIRTGKVFVDWSQNDEHKTTVAVYSLRARERPTVSAPVTWE